MKTSIPALLYLPPFPTKREELGKRKERHTALLQPCIKSDVHTFQSGLNYYHLWCDEKRRM